MPLGLSLSAGLGGALNEGAAETDRASDPKREPTGTNQEPTGRSGGGTEIKRRQQWLPPAQ